MAFTRVLIIDDEKENVRYLRTILEENGFTDIHAAYDGVEGMNKARELSPGLILLDLRMPKKSGIAVFNELKESSQLKDVPVIILTGEGGFLKHLAELRQFHENGSSLEGMPTQQVLERFIKSRPDAFLEKPVEPEILMATVNRILITIEEVRDRRIKEINALRSEKLNQKVIFKGTAFDADEGSRINLTASAVLAMAPGGGLPSGFSWKSADNRDIPMQNKDLLAFHGAVTRWVYLNYKASWDHKAKLAKISSIEEAEAYDISTGWPGVEIDSL